MLAVFFGSDRKAIRDRAEQVFQSGVEIQVVDEHSFVEGMLTDAVGASSLFGGSLQYLIDTPSSDEVLKEEVEAALAAMADSEHQFVIIEAVLLAPQKKKYAKEASVIEEFNAESKERFNAFAMADALVQKDKKTLWVLLQEAKAAGLREEEIIGMLWWQLKTLRAASLTSSPSEAGMKDFPYNKAKRALAKFEKGEVEKLSRSLLQCYHDGHKGLVDVSVGLEMWVLSV